MSEATIEIPVPQLTEPQLTEAPVAEAPKPQVMALTDAENMQWQAVARAKEKDKLESQCAGPLRRDKP